MNQGYKALFLAFLACALLMAVGLCWARTQVQAQNPPPKKAVEQQKQDPNEPTEEEYDAMLKATEEKDPAKQAQLCLAFLGKYPKSTYRLNVESAYQYVLYGYSNRSEWAKLEPAAEQWLKINPNDLKTQAYIFDAAVGLGHDEKVVEYGEKLYTIKPTADLARVIYQSYDKLGNKAKKLEWAQKLLGYPEFDGNFGLRMIFVAEYASTDLPKAADYSQQALKALAQAKKPDTTSEADWRKTVASVQRTCDNVIGMNYYTKEKWQDAIDTLAKAIEAEQHDGDYYYTGYAYWKLNDLKMAMPYFAAAMLLKGEFEERAHKNLYDIYRNEHNQTTTNIDREIKRGEALLKDGPSALKKDDTPQDKKEESPPVKSPVKPPAKPPVKK